MENFVSSKNFIAIGILASILAAGLLAFVFLGKVEDEVMLVIPEVSMKWPAPITCPDGIVELHPFSKADKQAIEVKCTYPMPVGTRDITAITLFYLRVLSYLTCFAPVLIVLTLIVVLMPSSFKGKPDSIAARGGKQNKN